MINCQSIYFGSDDIMSVYYGHDLVWTFGTNWVVVNTSDKSDFGVRVNGSSTATPFKSGKKYVLEPLTSTKDMFKDGNKIVTIKGLKTLDMSAVTDTSGMFEYCRNVQRLDVANWNTSNVTNMRRMFYRCHAMTSYHLDVSGWDTSNVTNMESLFESFSTYIDGLPNWNTSKVTNMYGMFRECLFVDLIDLSRWDTSSVTNMDSMFQSTFLPNGIENWDVSGVTDMSSMFFDSHKAIINLPSWQTSSLTNLSYIFCDCRRLMQLNLANWDTHLVTQMDYAFYNCSQLTTLNITNWDFSSTTNFENTFKECTSLTTIIGPVSGIKKTLNLWQCPLTHDSVMVIINGLATVSTLETLYLKRETLDTLSNADKAIATSRGWVIQEGSYNI